ncbi:hypothetical protein BDV98DRAFT_607974 [Pterulicium gracile]|uniref:Uncharacterized protein n=1 Tax=Pterulicium gracile TaxID=1884261 RepID=A0A5C3Q523_9AGAR|nr:hypothetical protein BDV98DRAFT_607974 [Pterula gracilis]
MSRRSTASTHDKRLSKHRVSDEDVFDYVLRVSFLSYLLLPKAVQSPVSDVAAQEQREHHSRLSGALSSSIFSIGDLFKDPRDGSKSVKFPEKLVKVLETKLQNIAMGKDPGFSDQLVRRTMAKFYGHFMDPNFKRQIKENRKIEELILMFATDATTVLRKEPSLSGDGWKLELNNHISQFVRMLRQCLDLVSHVSSELLSRLDMYTAKLAPGQSPTTYDSGYDSGSNRDSFVMLNNPKISGNVGDMALVKIVASLFKLSDGEVQREVEQLRGFCNEKAALTDLKSCLKNISAGEAFPAHREDFASEDAWLHWKTLETTHLQQLMLAMVKMNPELAKSTPSDVLPNTTRPGSLYSPTEPGMSRNHSVGSRRSLYINSMNDVNQDAVNDELNADDDVPTGHNFTYIPPNPRKYYKRLLEICLTADLEVMMSPEVDDSDEVSLGILSSSHIELLNECAMRWRIGHPYRAACFLDLVKQFFERNDVPMECVPEALQPVSKVLQDTELDQWPIADVDYLAGVYGSLFNIFLSSLYHTMDNIPHVKPSEIEPYITLLEHIRECGLLDRFDVDISARLSDIQERVKQQAENHYMQKLQELQSAPGVNRALPLLFMTDEIEKQAKLLDKRFPEPLLGHLDLVSLVAGVQIPAFIGELVSSKKRLWESSMNGPTPDVPIQDVFALYRRTKTLLAMHEAFCPSSPLGFHIGDYFEPFVRQWLVNTDAKTGEWVQAAINADKFESETEDGHSSSIIDLFDSLRSPINFMQELELSDEYQDARFRTSLSKTVSKAVEQYCRSIEGMFMEEMYPRPTDYLQAQKSSAWIEKARQLAITGDKKVEPFHFKPESCVKLNNAEAARKLLDNLYNQLDADKVSQVLQELAPPVPAKVEKERFLFTVKVVRAEGLVPTDSSPSSRLDTFVTLSDEGGNRVAKTRTIYETLAPRWEETFDISVDQALWLMVSIRDRSLVGKHDTVGRAYLCLDPRRFGDFLTHDLWMPLDSQGQVLLRVSMEGEKDDIQFYFGKAFRSLKRAETDMVRIFIDKMSPFVRQCLSRGVLKLLVKGGNTGLDYNKAIGNVQALYRSALGSSSSEVQIPLPQDEKPRLRPEELTDVQIEQAILPLFDYFDANLQTLNTYLSPTAKDIVMSRTWKEILLIIEGLLVPPLSDTSSGMRPLMDKEVDIVFKWLSFLRDYFHAAGEGLALEDLHNQKYRDVVSIRLYYDWNTDALMEECVRMMQQSLKASPTIKKRAKSVYHSRNLGTIKERKKEKKQEKEVSNEDTIMRILRMRPGTSDFIAQQLQITAAMQAEREKEAKETAQRKASRASNRQNLPPVPPLPS